ncbi:MAG: TonB family protein [Kofleriaceae bacterium]
MRSEPLPTEPVGPWWESPFVLALAGAIAIHLLVATFGDALVVLHPRRPTPPPPPKLELVDVEVPPIVQPPPPPVAPEPPPEPRPEPIRPAVVPQHVATRTPVRAAEPPPPSEPAPTTAPPTEAGGAPVVAMPDVAPAALGVAVAKGPVVQHVGRGGAGTGTGMGAGRGSGDVVTMSVATIKTRAMPRGDYSYEESKDYPADARRLGIEGKIRVKLIVDDTGAVKSVQLLNRLGHGLDELALARATRIAFEPAKDTDDKPVASVVVWTFNMELPK